MRQSTRTVVLLLALSLVACGKSAPDGGDKKDTAKEETPGITLTGEQSEALGLATAKLSAAHYRGRLTGYGVVVSIDTIAQADADSATAEAAAAQSAAAAARARDLSTGEDAPVSRETYEVAQAKAATDRAALSLARRKADAVFGTSGPWQNPTQRAAILARLQSGRAVLVKATFPVANDAAIRQINIVRTNGGDGWTASQIWDAPADPAIPGHSLYAIVEGSNLAQGERVAATTPTGAAEDGAIVPANALVLGESDAWVYVKTSANTYLRTRIDTSRPDGNGYFVSEGLKPGQDVVTGGAGQLYAREINPSTEPDD